MTRNRGPKRVHKRVTRGKAGRKPAMMKANRRAAAIRGTSGIRHSRRVLRARARNAA